MAMSGVCANIIHTSINLQSCLRSTSLFFRYYSKHKNACDELKQILECKIEEERTKIIKFRKECGTTKVGDINVNMLYGGMRGMLGLICETSHLDPEMGIKFRGFRIEDVQECLPKAEGGCEPLPEGMFFLLLTGEIPTEKQVRAISEDWARRSELPCHVVKLLDNLPKDVHPMAQISAAITVLDSESHFNSGYQCGAQKTTYWEYVLEDAMEILAKITVIAALIYRRVFFCDNDIGGIDCKKDWSHNFCKMMGFDCKEFTELMRLYLTIHTDHEGGNVSAHTTHLVGSALSSPQMSLAAGLNGLAGPLHGLANQEVLEWIKELQKELGEDPSEEELKNFVSKTLSSGRVIPGYGHAVLRKTDPRYTCQRKFAKKHLPDDPTFKVVSKLYKIVPPILKSLGKVQNPWPNVDAHSGALLQHYGLTQMKFYTVLFGVSRAIGVLSQLVWSRALLFPIERPKSITTEKLMKLMK